MMNKNTLIIAFIVVLGLIGGWANTEYTSLKESIAEAKREALAVAEEGKAAISDLRKIIADLRAKLLRQEQESQQALEQMELKAGLLQQQLNDAFEAELQSKIEPKAEDLKPNEDTANKIRDSPAVKPIAKVTMHSGLNCQPCEQWKRNELPKWQKAGWQVDVIIETAQAATKPWPWFEVCDGGKCYQVNEYLTADSLAKEKNR